MAYHSSNVKEQEVLKRIGLRVKRKRDIIGYTQEKVAELMNCSTTTISRLENGQQCMSVQNLIRLANVLETNVADFFIDCKFNGDYVMKSEDEQIKLILSECTDQQKQFFIELLRLILDYPSL